MKLSPRQDAAFNAVRAWLERWFAGDHSQQTFYLGGFAGSGKTTIAKVLSEIVDGAVVFCAYTGKAAHVLESKGCKGAMTIHRLIYQHGGDPPSAKIIETTKQKLADARAELTKIPSERVQDQDRANDEIKQLESLLKRMEEQSNQKGPRFKLNPDSDAKRAKLIVCDEVSMVDDRVGRDLESFKVPILALGDPAQLPPVYGTGYFTRREPDFLLDEVHRQAKDSPILWLATEIRNGRNIQYGEIGPGCRVLRYGHPDLAAIAKAADQIIVGRNATRHNSNAKMRQLRGFDSPVPVAGDRLICLRNDHEQGLLNGSLWNTKSCSILDDNEILVDVETVTSGDEEPRYGGMFKTWRHHFDGREKELGIVRRECQEFAYGYAITVHKSQGSQWDNVIVFDESHAFGNAARSHLYTAVTRAAKTLTVVR